MNISTCSIAIIRIISRIYEMYVERRYVKSELPLIRILRVLYHVNSSSKKGGGGEGGGEWVRGKGEG